MNKQFIVGKVDYVAEAMRLLIHTGAGETYGELKNNFLKSRNIQSAAFDEKFRVLTEIEKTMIKRLKGQEEELHFYFSKPWEEGKNAGGLAVLWGDFEKEPYESLEHYRQKLEALSQEECCKRFSELLHCYEAVIEDESTFTSCDNKMDVILQIMDMGIADEEKYKLQHIFLKPEVHRENVFALLEIAMEVLREYSEALDRFAAEFAAYWENELRDVCAGDYLKKHMGLDLEENPLGCGMRPNVILPSSISVFAKSEKDSTLSTPYIFTIGILFDDDFSVSFSGEDIKGKQECVLKILKILSDSSKFEILSYLKDKSAYGSQLAKHLGLTTATISHHMSALLSAGLVTMETKESKVYYKGNTKAIAEVLEYCKQVLAQ